MPAEALDFREAILSSGDIGVLLVSRWFYCAIRAHDSCRDHRPQFLSVPRQQDRPASSESPPPQPPTRSANASKPDRHRGFAILVPASATREGEGSLAHGTHHWVRGVPDRTVESTTHARTSLAARRPVYPTPIPHCRIATSSSQQASPKAGRPSHPRLHLVKRQL